MSNWFECKVNFDKIQENGAVKKVAEPYLVDAMTFTEAEARIIEELRPFISGDFNIAAVKRTRISEIFRDDTGDKWYLSKLAFTDIDPKSGKEKKTNSFILVQAKNFSTALENLFEGMKGSAADFDIVSINETLLMDVFDVKLDGFKKE